MTDSIIKAFVASAAMFFALYVWLVAVGDTGFGGM